MASSNFIEIESSKHFQDFLSEDLNRVSVINFWAPWAEPCKQMNEVARELSRKYKAALFLQVEAETQVEIADSFEIEAVPSFVILRGHTLLDRISGADATALTQSVAKYATTPVYNPLSRTDNAPAKAPTVVGSSVIADEKKESTEELNKRLKSLMNQSKVVLFMKGSPDAPRCGFSRKISGILQDQNVEFKYFDILTDESVRQGLKVLNDWPTFPQLIVNGELVGGLDIVQEMVENGEFQELVE
jgi:Grx4 family monothiol glutaredoxin